MSDHPSESAGSVAQAITSSVMSRIPDAVVAVSGGGGGHYTIDVVSTVFAGKSVLENQRLVLSAIKHLINGEGAPVHAVDLLTTRTP